MAQARPAARWRHSLRSRRRRCRSWLQQVRPAASARPSWLTRMCGSSALRSGQTASASTILCASAAGSATCTAPRISRSRSERIPSGGAWCARTCAPSARPQPGLGRMSLFTAVAAVGQRPTSAIGAPGKTRYVFIVVCPCKIAAECCVGSLSLLLGCRSGKITTKK